MASLDSWLHYNPSILNQGRTKHADPKPVDDVDPEELMKLEIQKDPWEARLKPCTQDKNTRGGLPAWILRSYGIDNLVVDPKTGLKNINYGTVVVRSLWWPGSFNLFSQDRAQFIYNGDGQKHELEGVTFYPISPPTMVHEREEKKCYDEPNPTAEWQA